MGSLRSLLRFDEKVAAEGRRIENLGGPPLRWVAPAVLFAALSLHAAILVLPAVHSQPPPAIASPVPDFPRVWRAAPPAPPPLRPPAARRPPAVPDAHPSVASSIPAGRLVRPFPTEPVPEPAPDLVLDAIPADAEAIIPNPDRPPPASELGPPSRVPGAPRVEAPPALLERVPPAYPVVARSLRAEARVTLRLIVLPDGRVGSATVVACTRERLGFEAAALEAVKRWRYEPAPAGSGARLVIVTIHFQREDERP